MLKRDVEPLLIHNSWPQCGSLMKSLRMKWRFCCLSGIWLIILKLKRSLLNTRLIYFCHPRSMSHSRKFSRRPLLMGLFGLSENPMAQVCDLCLRRLVTLRLITGYQMMYQDKVRNQYPSLKSMSFWTVSLVPRFFYH